MGAGNRNLHLRISCLALLLILTASALLSVMPVDSEKSGGRLSELIKFDLQNTRTTSEGVNGWNEFVVGSVNHTTTIETRLMNNGDVPLIDIEVTCTIYWYDGFYPDRGEVMFKDLLLVDLPGGDGSYSNMIEFLWVPTFSGAYMINLSAHVPGDARPMSTDPPFFQGIRYEPIPGRYFYSGVWVASGYWDGSSMDGWATIPNGSSDDLGWDSVVHPLSQETTPSHSAPYCFWAGNRTNWKAPTGMTYSLITPELDLKRFDPEPYDIERSERRPQIFFLYRYRGGLSSPGMLKHYVTTDGGLSWEPLLDLRDHTVNITGYSTSISWDYAKRPFFAGNGHMIGIDLEKYVGETIRIRFDQIPSGVNDTGYLLDDITLMGMDLVEPVPFELGDLRLDTRSVDPGSILKTSINVTPRKSIETIKVRLQAINASGSISPEYHVSIDPEVIELEEGSKDAVEVGIEITIPENERSGEAWTLIRAIGGGISEDLVIEFDINSKHGHVSKLKGSSSGSILPGEAVLLDLEFENTGNTVERVSVEFVGIDELEWSAVIDQEKIQPGHLLVFDGVLTTPPGTISGTKQALIVTSTKVLPDKDRIMERYLQDNMDPDWIVHELNYTLEQVYDIELIASSSYKELKEPPDNGTILTVYEVYLLNNGNGIDVVEFRSNSTDGIGSLNVDMPDELSIGPGESRSISVEISSTFPMSWGRYDFRIEAISSGTEDIEDNTLELTLVIGSQPISSGTFLINGSVGIIPDDIIMGTESIISFKAQTFGIPENLDFTVALSIDGKLATSSIFPYNTDRSGDYQIIWTFDSQGLHNISLEIFSGNNIDYPELGLLNVLEVNVTVRYIDLSVDGLFINGNPIEGDMEMEPGKHQISAAISNLGDIRANIATITLEVIEVGRPENRTLQTFNLTEIEDGNSIRVQFNRNDLLPERTYRITVSIGNKDKWIEGDQDNDELSTTIDIGEEPPEQPIWRNSAFIIITFISVFVLSILLFLYLMRKKL